MICNATWAAPLVDRLKAAEEIVQIDRISRAAVEPHGVGGGVYHAIVTWWVHWQARKAIRRYSAPGSLLQGRIPTGPIASWPEAWWRPIPEEEHMEFLRRQRIRAGESPATVYGRREATL